MKTSSLTHGQPTYSPEVHLLFLPLQLRVSSHDAMFVPVGHGALDEALVIAFVDGVAEGPTLAAGILMRLGMALNFSHYQHIIAIRPAA